MDKNERKRKSEKNKSRLEKNGERKDKEKRLSPYFHMTFTI